MSCLSTLERVEGYRAHLSLQGNSYTDMFRTLYQNVLQWLYGNQAASLGRIAAVGVGGAGGNAIDTISQEEIDGVDLIAINTDSQDLSGTQADTCLQVGRAETEGLGAGADPEVGVQAAESSREEIQHALEPYDMVIVTAGMGGGTGTGAAPIVAEIAQEMGILTIGIATRPFSCEGAPRMETAKKGIKRLRKRTETLIVIPNDRLLDLTNEQTSLKEAFRIADEVLCDAVRGIVEIITGEGLVNLDFADVEKTMKDGGTGVLGVSAQVGMHQSQPASTNGADSTPYGVQGDSPQATRFEKAALEATSSPLFDGYSIEGAENVLINVTGGPSLGFRDVMSAVEVIQSRAGRNSEVLFGATVNEQLNDHFRVTVIATGVDKKTSEGSPGLSSEAEVQSQQRLSENTEERHASKQDPKKRNGSVATGSS